MEIQCFWLDPIERERVSLRRYVSNSQCPGYMGYHNAMATIAEGPLSNKPDGDIWVHGDPRWPAQCEGCEYQFTKDDTWQCFRERLYRRRDTGNILTLREAPPGAMWDASWMHVKGPDGICLVVRCPPAGPNNVGGYDWMPDYPSTGGQPWTRTGVPPNVTANPSIGIPLKEGGFLYHGWLRDGKLIDA